MTDKEMDQPAINTFRQTANLSTRPMQKYFLSSFQKLALALFVIVHSTGLRAQEIAPTDSSEQLQPGQMPYFDAVPDPLEGVNRCSWAVNDWLFHNALYPFSFVYNVVAPKPLRTGISNAGHNLSYPVRLFNNCFQRKWSDAWEETERFGVNSTIGLGGLFDPATKLKIGRSDEDFGQTLGHYGKGPGFYLVLPLLGPCNARDAVGKLVDLPLDICFWIGVAYPAELWPDAIRPGITVNNLSGNAGDYKRELDSLVDPYQAFRTLYSLNRQRLILDYVPRYDTNDNPNPTIRAVQFKPVNTNFADLAVTRNVFIPATGKKLAYSCWMQKKPAPLVFYIPGLGAYRLDRSTLAYADMMYRHGYSVVAISDPFQKEFMESAATVALPGYGPADCDDVVKALKLILFDVRKWQGDKIKGTSLTGVSHGGYFTLMIAAREAAGKLDGLTFDRYVAVNPPSQLAHAAQCLDEMFDTPLTWPADERRKKMEESVYKALYFADNGLDVSGNIPLTRTESDFLIGLEFRYTLMNVIMDSQRRDNLGVLKVNPTKFVRQDSIREIRQISYAEYTDRFMLPYLIKSGWVTNRQELTTNTDLTQSTDLLRNNPKIRVQICEDDFLMTPADLPWFRSTFGNNLTVYPVGGHLGNLYIPAVQEALVSLFSDKTEETK
ncbi:MAG TPA: MlaA family lipoprotein [Candidatus Sulfotelmatobacter sp.]|jgi:phospholipid-binding lipoprotein MlaA|nr:MlaA family lipoprotein [Candidatus Sulfotelmatobacter sp.]